MQSYSLKGRQITYFTHCYRHCPSSEIVCLCLRQTH